MGQKHSKKLIRFLFQGAIGSNTAGETFIKNKVQEMVRAFLDSQRKKQKKSTSINVNERFPVSLNNDGDKEEVVARYIFSFRR